MEDEVEIREAEITGNQFHEDCTFLFNRNNNVK